MTDKELKKLSRGDLLELLVAETKENERLSAELAEIKEKLQSRRILIDNAGSIAEAALKLNGVFEAAQAAADQYLENIHMLNLWQNDALEARERKKQPAGKESKNGTDE